MFVLIKNDQGELVPATEEDRAKKNKLSIGDGVKCVSVKGRNLGFHRKYFSMLQLVLENIPEDAEWKSIASDGTVQSLKIQSVDALLWHLKFQTGRFTQKLTLGGKIILEPDSISFDSMSQEDFESFYSDSIDAVLKYIIPGTDRKGLEEEIVLNFG